jgi:uncharacterized protein YciI
MKAVVFYESATDLVTKAPPHFAAHRARWREFADRGELLMIGPFDNAQDRRGAGRGRGRAGGNRAQARHAPGASPGSRSR